MPTLRSVVDADKSKKGNDSIKETVVSKQPTAGFSEIFDWIKLLTSVGVVIGFAQLTIYIWWYQIPFPLSLSNFTVLLSIVAIFSLFAAVSTLVFYILYSVWNAIQEQTGRGPLAKPFLETPTPYIILVVIFFAALLPGATATALKEMGMGGGMKVVYHLSDVQMDNAPQNILEKCSPTGCVTKPLFMMIDGGDMVYVKLSFDRVATYYGIRKSEIVFIERLPDR